MYDYVLEQERGGLATPSLVERDQGGTTIQRQGSTKQTRKLQEHSHYPSLYKAIYGSGKQEVDDKSNRILTTRTHPGRLLSPPYHHQKSANTLNADTT